MSISTFILQTYSNHNEVLLINCSGLESEQQTDLELLTMTMAMTIFYSTIDIQIEKRMYKSLENQIINWSGGYY